MQPLFAGAPFEPSHDAMRYIMDAWEAALTDGVAPQMFAYSALYMALTDLVEAYGEFAVAELTDGLVNRIRQGEFTLCRTQQ